MSADSHTGDDGRYLIRSIYFDNYRDKALREKIDGVSRREKFRIRYYNDDISYMTLEKKVKDNSLCRKYDAPPDPGGRPGVDAGLSVVSGARAVWEDALSDASAQGGGVVYKGALHIQGGKCEGYF